MYIIFVKNNLIKLFANFEKKKTFLIKTINCQLLHKRVFHLNNDAIKTLNVCNI